MDSYLIYYCYFQRNYKNFRKNYKIICKSYIIVLSEKLYKLKKNKINYVLFQNILIYGSKNYKIFIYKKI